MAFDPVAYLRSVGVEPDVQNDAPKESVASGFDPEAYLRSVDSQKASSTFDPVAYLKSVSEPAEAVAPATQPAIAQDPLQRRAQDVGIIEGTLAAGKRGIASLGDVASGLGLAATSTLGSEADTLKKMQQIKAAQQVPQEVPGMSVAELERIYEKQGLSAAVSQVPKFITEQIAQSGPQTAIPLAAGMAASPFISPVGGALVGIGVYGVQQFGNFLVRQAQEKNDPKELEVAKAAITAGGTAPLGYFADRFMLGLGILGKKAGTEIAKELTARQLAAKVGKRVAVGATEGVIAEAPVEVLEQVAERYQAGLPLTGEEAYGEYKEAFGGAAAAGGGIGGTSRGIQAYMEPRISPLQQLVKEESVRTAEPAIEPARTEQFVPPSISQDTTAMLEETEGKPLVKAPEEIPSTPMVIPSLQTIEAPVADLKISKDVPQFKYGADASTGVVEPLGGKFERTGVAPIQLWERNNGDLEVISGRHRLDLAKRSGEATIPAQVHKESEGFDVTQAASLDALLNIREGQGKVKDYVTYFQRPGYTREEAESSGVLARSTGQRAYSIATNGSSDLIAAHRADVLTDEAATRIANSAPKEDSVQALGMKLIQEGKSINNAVNMMQAVKAISGGRGEATTDMFGFDDSAMREAEEMAKIASKKQADISQDLSAVTGASKRPEVAKKYGVDVRDPASLQAKIDELRQQKMAWENWSSNPALVTQIQNQIRGIEPDAAPEVDTNTPSMFSRDTVEQLAKEQTAGKVLWQEGDLGLFHSFNAYGGPHYRVAKGNRYYANINEAPISPAEKAILQQKVDAIESSEAIKHAKTPFIKFQNGISISGGVPKNVGNVVRAWKNLLGIKANVYISTKDFVEQNKDNFTGPHRDIQAALSPRINGAMKLMSDGSYYVVFKNSTSTTKMLETLAHELGHVHEKEVFVNASPELKKKIQDEFFKWLSSQRDNTARQLVESMRAKTTAQTTKIQDERTMARHLPPYWRAFEEWYADQVARWAVSSEKPITVVDKFFAKLGAALRKFYETVKGQKYLPNETFKQYLDELASRVQFEDLATQKAPKGQMALFSRSEIEAEGPKGIEKLNRIRRNYRGEVVSPTDVFSIPDDSKMERFIYKIQDKYIDTKRVIQAIISQGKEITDKWNAYLKEELYHGRTAKRTKDFLNNELLPIVRTMRDKNVSIVELDTYLQARHAEERNEQIAKINPEFLEDGTINPNAMPDGGSGMFTKDAQDYLNNLPPEKAKSLEELAKKIDAIVKGTQQVLINAGLESQATIDVWNKTYKKYVPLMRKDLDFAQDYTGLGQGFQTRGGASKRAFGSFKEVADIFANIANQRERAIVRAEKARVGTALYGLAIMNPNPDFWLPVNPDAIKNEKALFAELRKLGINEADAANIIQEPQTAVLDPDTGTVTYKVNPILRNSPNVFAIRINGQERFIFFNASDPRAMRMVQAIKNLDAEEMGWALGNAAKVTRWIASVNTQYNPVFGAYNFIRDTLGAQFNLSTTAIAGKQAQVTAGVFPALTGIYSDLRTARAGKGVAKGEWAKLWEEYQQEGGATGYRDQFSKNRSDQNVIEKEMRNLEKGNIKKGVAAVFNWLSDYNDAMENAVRLSAYKVAIDQGISKEQAASIAKNLTVNFNRKGERAQQLGSLYAFYNASVQGTARLAETLRGPAGKKIVAGGLLLGSVQALALAMMGFKDDEPPEFIKSRNLVIPFPDGHYFAIPMPLGLHIIPNMGRITTEMVMNGGKNAGKKVANLTGVLMDAFNPIGNAGLSMQSLSPTMLDPIAAIIENKDSFGRPIAKEDRATNPTPGYTRARETASYLGKELSYFLNLASGGTKYQKGLVSPTPDQIDFLFGQATGGIGREISKVEQTVTAATTGEEMPTYKVPLVGKFYGDVKSQAAQANRFYDNITRMANYENELKGRQKDRIGTADFLKDHPEARLWQQANRLENEISKINREKKDLLEKNAAPARIKQLEDRKTRVMTQFNNQVESLEK
jgi:Large polyvalent protein associated domain 38